MTDLFGGEDVVGEELTDDALDEIAEELEELEAGTSEKLRKAPQTDELQLGFGDDWGKVEKPPYRIPLVSEIRAMEKRPHTLVSTFSGCGGASLGFRMDGWRVLYVNEFIEAARQTYLSNFPDTLIDPRDIRDVTAEEILEKIGRERGDVDVLEGSPPCASFSMAGKREKGWGKVKKYSDTEQRVDDLFWEFARVVEGIQPRVFVAENVPGLLIGTARPVLKEIMQALREAGYAVTGRVLDAQWLGVPQRRRRLIFQGIRKDLIEAGHRHVFPENLQYNYTIRDALPHVVRLESEGHGHFEGYDIEASERPAPTVATSPGGAGYYRHEATIEQPVAVHNPHGYAGTVEVNGKAVPRKEVLVRQEVCPPITATGLDAKGHAYEVEVERRRVIIERPTAVVRKAFGPKNEETDEVREEVCPTIMAGGIGGVNTSQYYLESTVEELEAVDISRYAIGAEWDKLEKGEVSKKYLNLIKADEDKPCPTVTAAGGGMSAAAVVHPTEKRKFTIPELKRLCGFPDDFEIIGSFAQQWERMGRAVPPPMYYHLAVAIREQILEKL